MNAAKWLLWVAWLMAIFSIYRFAPILRQPVVPRLLFVMVSSGIVGLGLYYLSVWMTGDPIVTIPAVARIRPPSSLISIPLGTELTDDIQFNTSVFESSYSNGTKSYGIEWYEHYIVCNLEITNLASTISKLEIMIGFDKGFTIVGAAQTTKFAGIQTFPEEIAHDGLPSAPRGAIVQGEGRLSPPLENTLSEGFYYRITCEKIFAETIVSFVIAIDPPEKRPMPKNIIIRGRYETGESTNVEIKSFGIVRPTQIRPR